MGGVNFKGRSELPVRLNTHEPTPIPKIGKLVLCLFVLSSILIYGMFIFIAFLYAFYENDLRTAIFVISMPVIFTIILFIKFKDIRKAYVEIDGDTIHVVDYYFGIEKEKYFSRSDITSTEIVSPYSFQAKGYRIGVGGTTYIIFRKEKKYLFKIICLPETKEIFKQYINAPAILD